MNRPPQEKQKARSKSRVTQRDPAFVLWTGMKYVALVLLIVLVYLVYREARQGDSECTSAPHHVPLDRSGGSPFVR